ncbi:MULTISPECIES: efflux RND transporter permease subunit [Thalassolituus]|uniref:efflux RND transporter permease subunit n=1 Tax=Thalassolituus TaxID=187492 RepID=UPI002648EB27|nr:MULTISPECIES: CusA/CzcA family heavy metal efflux RND transporter [Thalassolituus]|tara:strand:+ start:89570 stop:92713 length:3144 start_codon:yes stop_codon:yes gene_type:complete
MLNAIIRLAVERRFMMLASSLVLIAAGLWSYRYLPIDAVPDITNVQVQINTEATGYSPLEAEQRVTFPVETALYGLPQLEYTRSLSRYGLSQVTVVFKDGTDIYHARNLIDQRLGQISDALPEGLKPVMGPISTGLGEIFSYTVTADSDARQPDGSPYDAMALRTVQDWIIRPQLAQVAGVAEINTSGGFEEQIHIRPDPALLLQHQITVPQLVSAIRRNNSNRGAGYIEVHGEQQLVRAVGQLKSIEDIRDTVVARNGTAIVRIRDLAEVTQGEELRTGAATRGGSETVLGSAMMLMGENPKEVAEALKRRLQDIATSLPDGVTTEVVYNRTDLVGKTLATVQTNLLEGALLVIFVLFIMLRNLRAALITAAVIPLAMLATITGMVQAGVSANLMSLGALDFGLIVDGAVIIVENCVRRLSASGSALTLRERLELVYSATAEVMKPSLFGVAIITLVYIPIFSLTGIEGKMFHPMAATVVIALLSAMIISITLVPAAIAVFLRNGTGVHHTEPSGASSVESKRYGYQSLYERLLRTALRAPVILIGSAALLIVGAVILSTRLGSEFIPQLDEGDIALHALRIPGTSLQQSLDMQVLLEERLLTFPEVKTVFSRLGTPEIATDPMPPNVADTFIILKPKAQWPDPERHKADLVEQIEASVRELPGNNYEFTQPIQMRFNELISGVRADLGVKVFGDDLSQLLTAANEVAALLNSVDGSADVRVEQVTGLPVLTLHPNHQKLAAYGLTVDDIQSLLSTAVGGQQAGLIYRGDQRIPLVVRFPEPLRENADLIKALPIPLADGGFVPLSEVADVVLAPAPAQISRENGKRRIVVSANVRGRDLGSFVKEVRQKAASEVSLPSGYWLEYGGTFEQLQSAEARLRWVVPATLALILFVLISAFGNLRGALIIFSGVPLALTGGIFLLWLRGMPMSISAAVGFIALSGISVLNGLVMLTFIRQLRDQGVALRDAVIQGATMRLRPVLMTALVAGLGFVPMALNTGIGAEVQRPLATVVIGGIISATTLTLFVVPVLYFWLHRRSHNKASLSR